MIVILIFFVVLVNLKFSPPNMYSFSNLKLSDEHGILSVNFLNKKKNLFDKHLIFDLWHLLVFQVDGTVYEFLC